MEISCVTGRNSREKLPLVSIVTPAYNAERFIEDTIKSVMNQTYPYIEHIIIDDGSTDGTPQILQKYESLYNLKWFSKKNEGQAITVNRGFDLASGEIVVWLNADDVLFTKDVIYEVVKAFIRQPIASVVYGHMAIIDEENHILKIQYAPPKLNFEILLIGHFAPCVFYRKDIVSKYKLDVSLNYAIDYDQCLRMAKDGIIFYYINKPLIAWRRHKATKSLSGRNKLKGETIHIKKKYGVKMNHYKYSMMKVFYYTLIFVHKIYGVKDILELYATPKRRRLAFNAKFDSLTKLIFRQVIPYK
ncbi:MAG: glycosyltransferase [archaeon YNP-LCB-003-016]|uniref:glycosyltransferase family 2 protein n=1 Tax=Candidatus Culexarchaeum yellowstonense TaxID=2928963 RepID=UPI0026E963E7|nr:glycosyltransferase family 2 protein [Candidatus Culexarchaeum yellowstonense]MCR6691285.1 glycosyltransferase [Candidatus Culexarchaeum yellowstonense]